MNKVKIKRPSKKLEYKFAEFIDNLPPVVFHEVKPLSKSVTGSMVGLLYFNKGNPLALFYDKHKAFAAIEIEKKWHKII